jgi:hypothetical protein
VEEKRKKGKRKERRERRKMRRFLVSYSFLSVMVFLELNLWGVEGAHPLAKLRYWLVFHFYILTLTSIYQKRELCLDMSRKEAKT